MESEFINKEWLGENIIFLISQPRSGSTLLQRIIAGHPEVHSIAEPWIMLHPLYALKQEGITAEYDSLLARQGLEDFLTQIPEGVELYIKAIRNLASILYNKIITLSGKKYFLDKTPRYYYVIPELYRIFPNAKFIFLFRNPLAVMSSTLINWCRNKPEILKKSLTYNDLTKGPNCLTEGVRLLGNNGIVVHYEALVKHPKDNIQNICTKMGIDFHEKMLEYGQNPAPKGRFGDSIKINDHTNSVSDYIDLWIENLSTHELIDFANEYLSSLGPSLVSAMGYSYQEIKEKLNGPIVLKETDEKLAEKSLEKFSQSTICQKQNAMIVATSLAPRDIEIQTKAVDSWMKLGLKVFSINCQEEIDLLIESFPQVNFIKAKRNGKRRFGKPYIYFDDFLLFFRKIESEICGIINSDIILSSDIGIVSFIQKHASNSLVYGSRIEIKSLDNLDGDFYDRGFDFFFFDKSILSCFVESEACIGVTWWDYWAALIPVLEGIEIKKLLSPLAYHVTHSYRWDEDQWHYMGKLLSGYLYKKRSQVNPLPQGNNPLKIFDTILFNATNAFFMNRELGSEERVRISYEMLSRFGISILAFLEKVSTPVKFEGSNGSLKSVNNRTVSLNGNSIANDLNKKGEELIKKGDLKGALQQFLGCIEIEPVCSEVHSNLGLTYLKIGNLNKALLHFKTALEIDSNNEVATLYCGKHLINLGKYEEARLLYSYYLLHDPGNFQIGKLLSDIDCRISSTIKPDDRMLKEPAFDPSFGSESSDFLSHDGFEDITCEKKWENTRSTIRESDRAHQWLDGLYGIEIGPSAHNPFGLDTINVGLSDAIYEQEQIHRVGKTAELDIVARADDLPIKTESKDFIITSHVIEHCPNFVKTMTEWFRVVKKNGYIFIITPHRSAAPSDFGKSLTSWNHLFQDFVNDQTPADEPEAGRFGHCHYHVFSFELMKNFIHRVFGDRMLLVDSQKNDDKDGTGFSLIYQKKLSINESFSWKIKSGQKVVNIRQNNEWARPENLIQMTDKIKVSAIVSSYNSENFIRGCLKDLMEQSLYKKGKLEVIVVDSGSQQVEGAIVKEFQNKYSNIKYIRIENRETIYKAWNRGIKASSGKYITNANTDDRHRIDAFERLAEELEKNPDIGLVYADVFVTNFENQVFGEHIHCGYHIRPEYSKEIMLSGCHMGPQPMWRKSIHESVGYFSDEYQSAGDYDFWCRVALNFPMKHVPELLGLYYENPKGFCNSKKALSIRETVSIQKKYQGSFPVPGKTEKYINNYQFPQYVKDKKYVNISMVTYNRLNFTIQSIESILKSTRYPFVITVIDNNSSDGTKEYLAELHRKGIIKNLVILEENVGVAKASNLAWYLEQHAEYYLKFDNDIVIKKADWLFNMVKAIDAIPELGAIAYNFEPYSYPLSTMNGVKCRIKKHNNLGGACILIPKRTREQLGFWCEDFGLYGEEDADYGERIRLKGLLNAYMKDENIGIHLPGGRAARIDPKTLNAHDGAEEIIHSEYRQWKDNIRRQIIASGVFKNRVEGYRKGQYPLNIESEFTKEFLAKQNSMKQANETGLEIELATPPNSIQTSNPTHSIKTSIIIVTYNSSTDIKKCLESITKNTHRTYEIIIIDNCSSDGTREFLKTLEKVNIILNPVNLGFSKGCNQGIEAAKGEYIVLLNPDTVVTDKWDEKLISHFNDSVGAVGPLSNYVAGRQKYEFYTKERLATLENVDSFSKNIYHQNKGKNRETKLLIGFCMMIKREVIDAVGMLDETLFLGNDDLDLSLRLRNRGYRLLVAIDTFIYHKGQASFDSEPKEKTDALVQESTNTLYQKLKEQYGDGRIPNSQELWDIGWFKPNQQVHQKNGLTSVIILTYNQLKYTVKCIESIFKYTSKSFEIIIVDNGSSDGTVEYLESEVLGRNTAVRVKIIKNIENKGFAGGNNQGIAAAAGHYILLLNNDVVVTPGWLELLINCAERNSKIGIVGPRSNYVSGPQLVKEVSYDTATLKGLSEYVNRFVDSYSGQVQRVLRVVGFCMLIKRTVIEKIGGLDDRYGLGNFEDDDLSLRAAIAGFESWIAKDCFIHHFGSRTFIGANLDFSKSLHNNWEIFKKKWGLPEDLPYGSPYRMSQMSISGFDSAKHYIPLPKQDDAAKMVENDFQDPAKMYHDLLSKLSTCGPEDVLKDLERFVSSYPAFALAHNDLGVLCYNTGLKEKAVHHYQKAVQLDPNNISFQKNLADFYYVELRRVEDALQIYVNILETHPKDVETLLAIGCICSALGKFDDAIDFYKRVLEIEPGNEDAKENLEALKNYQIHGKTQLSHGGGIFQDSIRENITDADPSKAYDQGFSVSIIIGLDGVQNRLKECVDSIRQHTFEPHEIIFIDDGATKGIQKWVQRMVADNPNYRFLKVGKKIGWPAAINRGLSAASGEFVAILQNDVVVSEGWLSDMLECIHRKPNIAVVGPMINDAEGIQKAIHVNCCSMDDFDAASKKFRKLNRHRRVPVTNLSSCCLLFRKEVLGDIGLLDESFSTEEMAVKNFCIRASYHGYRNFIAADVLVYHTNRHQTTKGRAEIDPAKVRDRKVFKEKLNALEMKNEVGRQLQMLKILEQAEELNQKGQVDRAIDTLLHGIGLKAEDRRCYLALAEILIKAKRFQGALDALNEMPNSNKSETAYSGNGGKRREDDLHSTLLHPTTMHQQDLRKLELCGYCEEGLENLGKAQNHADRVLALNPSSAPALNLKGILAYKRNDKKSAEAYFSKALESDPSYGEAYTNLGTIQWEEGQGREALSNYERGFILDPTDLEIATIYHSAVAALGEFERAQSFVQDAAGLHPPNKKIKYMLIDILTRQGKFSEAINEIEEAVAKFGIEDGILDAALKIRDKLGPIQVKKPLTRPAVSLCMIVKNEEHYLAKCLASAEPVVDEMIVVDTGSTDRTKDIAKVFGAQVYDFKWGEDFAEARNFSISKASGDWIFIMDGDEVLSSLDYEGFKNIVKKRPEGPIAYSIVTRNYCTLANSVGWVSNDGKYEREEASIGWIPSAKVRLFYGRDRICFEGAVHEMVEPVLKRNGIPIKHCNLPIHHYGRLDKEKLESKGEKYFEIGKKKLEAMGDDISAVRELAVQAAALGKNEEAIGLWQRFLSLDPSPVLASEAFINLGTIYSRLEKYDDALLASKKALELTPDVKEAHNNFALGKFYLGNVEEAIPIFEKLLKQFPEYLSAQFKLAAAYCSNGQKEKGKKTFEMLRQTTKMGHAEMAGACHDLAKGLASAQRLDYAIGLLNASIENNYINDDLLTLLTECLKQGNSLGS